MGSNENLANLTFFYQIFKRFQQKPYEYQTFQKFIKTQFFVIIIKSRQDLILNIFFWWN